jgi:nucleoid DNA-binding protein
MAEARRMGKSELFAKFAEHFELKRVQARDFFEYLAELSEKELKRAGEFVLPDMVKLVVRRAKRSRSRRRRSSRPASPRSSRTRCCRASSETLIPPR